MPVGAVDCGLGDGMIPCLLQEDTILLEISETRPSVMSHSVERLRVAHVRTSLRHRESEVCKGVAAGRRFVIKMNGGVKWGNIELRFDLLLCHGHRLGERIWAAECHGGHFDDSKCC